MCEHFISLSSPKKKLPIVADVKLSTTKFQKLNLTIRVKSAARYLKPLKVAPLTKNVFIAYLNAIRDGIGLISFGREFHSGDVLNTQSGLYERARSSSYPGP